MSFRKKGRKVRPVSGITFPRSSGTVDNSDSYDFKAVIAETLHSYVVCDETQQKTENSGDDDA